MESGGTDQTAAAPVSVLVVDDDPTSRMLVAAALQSHVHAVAEAENGAEAVQILEQRDFDIAIVDLDMPVMDGFGVIGRARANPRTRHLPIIVVTGRDDVVAIERAFALGATSFLCKPINWNVFRHQVGYVLQVSRAELAARRARDAAETLAAVRQRSLHVLEAEIATAVAKIAFSSVKGAQAALAEIFAVGERLQTALRRVRRAAEILSAEVDFQPRSVAAADLVAEAIGRVDAALGGGAVLRIDVAAAADLHVLCDRAMVGEALAEVLANALLYSPPGERVRLTALQASPDRIRFEVEDRGSGIPEDLLEWGFTAADGAAARRPSGFGLGLATARAIVERHGGHFGVMTEVGRGAEVFLSFPSPGQRRPTAAARAALTGRTAPAAEAPAL